jgi:multidrug efflux pump subunit AcrA (membrane-fusion protein)
MKKHFLKGIFLSSCIALLIWSLSEEDLINQRADKAQQLPTVSVLEVVPKDSSLTVKASGLTIARWPLAIKSAVVGRVVAIHENTNPGDSIDGLQMLVKISAQPYRVSVGSAKAKVSRAEFELTNYKHKQYVAKKISGEKKLSLFGSFEAHILTAKSELNYAKSELEYALQMLKETNVKSPYPSIVVKKWSHQVSGLKSGNLFLRLYPVNLLMLKCSFQNLIGNGYKVEFLLVESRRLRRHLEKSGLPVSGI